MGIPQDGLLKKLYAVILAIIVLVTILTPFLAEGATFLREEYVEAILLAFLLSTGYVARVLYKREAERARRRIADLESGPWRSGSTRLSATSAA
jgi:hypothetical protein